MIDLHTHLLPGVDDGSRSIADSLPVIAAFREGGVTAIACTPHLEASRMKAAPVEAHRQLLRELQQAAGPAPRLLSGWEIMIDAPGGDYTDPRLHLGDSNAVLVEFMRTNIPAGADDELWRIRTSGVVPVVAHPERYWGCTVERVEAWRRYGAVIQLDVSALLASRRVSDLAAELLARGLADIVASDTHIDQRSLVAGRAWLTEYGSPEIATLLTAENPRRVLAGEEMLPVPPLRLQGGWFSRLRSLVLGKH